VYVNGDLWTGAVRSLFGLYSSTNVPSGTGTAMQVGTRGTGNIDAWNWNVGTLLVSTTAYTPPINEWIHIAYVYTGSVAQIYINGILNNSKNTSGLTGSFDMVFVNGYMYGGLNETSTFICDELVAYNRALSAAEILTMYNSQGSRSTDYDGLIAYFNFGERYTSDYVRECVDESIYKGDIYPQNNGVINQVGATGWTTGAGFTITQNVIGSPDGTTTTGRIVFTTTSNANTRSPTITTTATTKYFSSFYIKNNSSTGSISLVVGNVANTINSYVTFNLSDLSVTASGVTGSVSTPGYNITSTRDGWSHVQVWGTFNAAGTVIANIISAVSGTGNFYVWNPNITARGYEATYEAQTISPSDIRMVQT
jgi:hypothetical protein